MSVTRLQILITGQVQGVGFRPHVFRIATKLELTGWVQNNGLGVLIEVQGAQSANFIAELVSQIPPLAYINSVTESHIPSVIDEQTFIIKNSDTGIIKTIIAPDIGICAACLYELFDVHSHYYLYPFLNCTHCGPRFTITKKLPYDRLNTAMESFPLCSQCSADYYDINNRRYHAQPTACHMCGPKLNYAGDTLDLFGGLLKKIGALIRGGKIIALKGLGGYQIICDAKNIDTVNRLRINKKRKSKPFALMSLNTVSLKGIVKLDKVQQELLESKERPIVLLPKLDKNLDNAIAPNLDSYGVMLPSTPLHYLLFYTLLNEPSGHKWLTEEQDVLLIVTSANISGEPLICDDEVAINSLKYIVDEIFTYDRHIVSRVDDSIIKVINDKPVFIRRARGFTPSRIKLAHKIPVTLGLGAHLKNTFCLTRDDEAFVSQYIGSLSNKETIDFFQETLQHFLKFLSVTPERIAHDLHPDFYTTHLALDLANKYNIESYGVSHHHAHLASVLAEYNIKSPVLGLVLDGYGYGADGGAWGGELLLLENALFEHLGGLAPISMPGGDAAIYEPWRMGASVLYHLGKKEQILERFFRFEHAKYIEQLLDKNINSPLTSSCGRLFDAVSSLLGVTLLSQYEGEAAMRLESLVTKPEILTNGWQEVGGNISFWPLLEFITNLLDPVLGANIFHGTLSRGLAVWINRFANDMNIKIVLLSGGCLVNKFLAEGICRELGRLGIKALLPQKTPVTDGGISLGQAWSAGNIS